MIKIFFISRNRSNYTWSSLDSLYKNKSKDSEVILIDNDSNSETIHTLKGFEKRGLFSKCYYFKENNARNFLDVYKSHIDNDDHFIFMESDVQILTKNFDQEFLSLIKSDDYGWIGSMIDRSDFHLINSTSPNDFALLKLHSPERRYPFDESQEINNLQPPGRLSIINSKVFDMFDKPLVDGQFDQFVRNHGKKSGISTNIKHRHLSLLNYFDYPEYNMVDRTKYFTS